MMKILIVDDDEQITTLVHTALTQQNYKVDIATDGQDGWYLLEATSYALVLLDVILPKLNGIQFCQRLRNQKIETPVLMLTARDSSTDKILGLDAGADDYVVKPFDVNELVARVRALLRRGMTTAPLLEWGPLQFDPSSQAMTYAGHKLSLRPKELSLLELFLRNKQHVFSRQAILDHLWSWDDCPNDSTVKAHIRGIRQALKSFGGENLVETLYGQGYRLNPAFLNSALVETSVVKQAKSTQPPESAAQQVWKQVQGVSWQRITSLRAIVEEFKQQPCPSSQQLEQASTIAHQLAGTLGSFGLQEASILAKQIERDTNSATVGPLEIEQMATTVLALQNCIQQALTDTTLLSNLSRSTPPVPSSRILLISRDLNWVNQLLLTVAQARLPLQLEHCLPEEMADHLVLSCPDTLLLELSVSDRDEDLALLKQVEQIHGNKISICVVAEVADGCDRLLVAQKGAKAFLLKTDPLTRLMAVVQQGSQGLQVLKVVVLTQDQLWVRTIAEQLLCHQIQLVVLPEATQFWQVVQQEHPKVLLVDSSAPEGLTLCQAVQADPIWEWLPIILVYDGAEPPMPMQQYLLHGIDYCLEKQGSSAELKTRILQLRNRLHSLQERFTLSCKG